jgi:hypothetical protein
MYDLNHLEMRMNDGDRQAAAELRQALEAELPRIIRAVLRRPDLDFELARRIRSVATDVRRQYDVDGFQLVRRVTKRICEALVTNPASAGTWVPSVLDTLANPVPAHAGVAV